MSAFYYKVTSKELNKILLLCIMSNNNIISVCNDPAYINAINQRRRFALLNIPPARYDNLAINPYTIINPTTNQPFTKYQIDMRRKVEILKYSSNKMSTRTNSLTKAEKYAQLVNGSLQKRTYSRQYLTDISNGNVDMSCNNLPTPSTSCNVPGPAILLYEDENVPLYNFTNDVNTASFGIINAPAPPDSFNYTQTNNIPLNNTFMTITSLYILNTNYDSDIFTISIPLSAKITAETTVTHPPYPISDMSFSIISAKVNVLYSYSNVPQNAVIPITNSPVNIVIDLSNATTNHQYFTANIYFGELVIDQLSLYTQKGHIYDIQLHVNWTYNLDPNYRSYFNNPEITLYANPTSDSVENQINCVLTPSNSPMISTLSVISQNNYLSY